MDIISLNIFGNNNKINDEDQKNLNEDLLSKKSYDDDTVPDEDFNKTNNKKRSKLNSYPNVEHKGPNINLKINHKRYSNQKEKEFFF